MAAIHKAKRLAPEARAWLEAAIAQDRYTLAELVLALQEQFGETLSKSAMHRYRSDLQERTQAAMARVRATAEAARAMAEAAPDEADQQSAATIRILQSGLFEALLKIQEAEGADPAEQVKLLAAAARAAAEASRASIGQKRWASEVRAKLDALEAAQEKGSKRLDEATLKAVREALYGG